MCVLHALFFESHHGVVLGASEGGDSDLVMSIAITDTRFDGASSENDFISPLQPLEPFPCAGPRFLPHLSGLKPERSTSVGGEQEFLGATRKEKSAERTGSLSLPQCRPAFAPRRFVMVFLRAGPLRISTLSDRQHFPSSLCGAR